MIGLIEEIVKECVNAPSGDNAQPWRFVIKNSQLFIFNIPGGDQTMYNYRERGSYIAHGALLENIDIISRQKGLIPTIAILPDPNQSDLTGVVGFTQGEVVEQELYKPIFKRCTNRRAYKPEPLPEQFWQQVSSIKEDGVDVNFNADIFQIAELGKSLSLNERLILENYHIHQPLFSYIRWTREEEVQKGNGMYIKTLDLPPPAEKAFRLFRNWPIISFLKNFGITKMVSRDSAKLYATSAAFIMLSVSSTDAASYIKAGRAMQRIWLLATAKGISLQPTAALFYLAQRISEGDTEKFNQKEIVEIQDFESKAKSMFNVNSHVAMLMRVGYADPPSAVSAKRSPQVIIET